MSPHPHQETVRLRPPAELLDACRETERPTRPAPFWVETIRKSLAPDPGRPYATLHAVLYFTFFIAVAAAAFLVR
jgi:hypothetical protein